MATEKKKCRYNLKRPPKDMKWSGEMPPPAPGTKVRIKFNGLGTGTVRNYFVEHGYLGVRVDLDDRPEWHRKQNPRRPFGLVFGAEIELL